MYGFTLALVCFVLSSSFCLGQDSGPGPIAPATENIYQATLFRHFSADSEATFSFSTTAGGDGMNTSTSGTFQATVQGGPVSGNWAAIDVGGYAIWTSRGNGETQSFSAIGLSTPDVVVGRAVLSSSNQGGLRLLRWLGLGGQTYWFHGEAEVQEPTEPDEATP